VYAHTVAFEYTRILHGALRLQRRYYNNVAGCQEVHNVHTMRKVLTCAEKLTGYPITRTRRARGEVRGRAGSADFDLTLTYCRKND